MKSLSLGSISRNLALLVILAVLPALAIILYNGMEQRQRSIENAKQDVLLLTNTMAEAQEDIVNSVRQVLSTLSLLPQTQALDIQACNKIIKAVLEKNTDYLNIALTDLNGEVLVSGKPIAQANLADRKHFRDALERKDFVVGEYIISRVGTSVPVFPFAYPVLDKKGRPLAVLTMVIKLDRFSRFHDVLILPEKSFIAMTDHQGVRLFYYPPSEDTNPVGKSIKAKSWEIASKAQEPGIFIGQGSDGVRRIFAFEQVRLSPADSPYLYVWTGTPEAHFLAPANAALTRNLLLLLMATLLSLFISWVIGKHTLIGPIKRLVALTQNFAEGNFEAGREQLISKDEFGTLNKAFLDMADALSRNQRTLRNNEARFRLLMDSLNALVYVADMQTYEVIFINEYGKKTFGDITGKICWQSLQKNKSGPCHFCTNKYLLDENGQPGEVYSWEFSNTKTGQFLYVQDRAIQWLDDRIVRLEVAMDISGEKLAETKLAEESERLAVTLRSIGDGVITTDFSGDIVLLNTVAEELTGWSSEEAVGRSVEEVFHIINEQTREVCGNPVTQVIRRGQVVGLTNPAVLVARDGLERNIGHRGAPILDANNNIIGVVLVFRDISEQLKAEKELLKARKIESIGVLAGGIAHDFNNILAAILGNINLALFDPDLKDKTKKLLSEAEKASFRAKDLTQQLLTFAKGGEPVKEASSLENVIKDSANFVLHGDQVACRYDIPEDLWIVDIDKGQISQVIQNIVLNASHAMPGGGTVAICCENFLSGDDHAYPLLKKGRFAKISIQDSGIGMPANVVEKIFDPYFSTKHEGSGLGLAITQSIINKHGGYIFVESSSGVGTTFTLYLPASEQEKVQSHKLEDHSKASVQAKILIMDDERMVQAVAEAMLVKLGHEVVLSANGEEAIKLYQESMTSGKCFDLVIMDLTIPGGMGGEDAVRGILDLNPKAKVIVSSGYSNDPIMANCADFGFCSAIVKPYQLQELSRVVGQIVD